MHCTHGGSGDKIVRIRRVLWLATSFPHRPHFFWQAAHPSARLESQRNARHPAEELNSLHNAQCTIQKVAHWDTCAPCWTVGRLHLHFVTSLSGQPERQEQAFDTSWLSNVSLSRQTHIKLIIGCDPSIIGAKQKGTPTCMRTFSRAVAQNGSIHCLRLRLLPHLLHRGPCLSLSGNENPSKVSSRRWDKSPWSVSETENWKPSSFEKKVETNLVGSTWGQTNTPEPRLSCITSKEITWSKGYQVRRWTERGGLWIHAYYHQLWPTGLWIPACGPGGPTIGGAAGARKVSWGQPKSPSALTPLPSLTS